VTPVGNGKLKSRMRHPYNIFDEGVIKNIFPKAVSTQLSESLSQL
jgi:hypothetical protein